MTKVNEQPSVEQVRAELVEAIETAGLQSSDGDAGHPHDIVKAGGGLSIELRYNGETIPLGGRDVNELSKDDFQPFLQGERLRIEGGELDDAIARALQAEGTDKAVVRVRAIDQ